MTFRFAPVLLLAVLAGAARAQTAPPPLTVYAAGSTTGALGAMLARYTAETGVKVDLHTGPAGLLLDGIERGERADVFVSANLAHPMRLTAEHKATATVVFAHNHICLSARPEVGLTGDNIPERLLDSKIRVGSSTPGADPGGDYAWELFDKIGALRPGAAERLKSKTRQVVGGRVEPPTAGGATTTLQQLDRYGVDVMVGYCSSRSPHPDTSVTRVRLPSALAFPVDYGLTAPTASPDPARREAADRLALYLLSPPAQALLVPYGLSPAGSAP